MNKLSTLFQGFDMSLYSGTRDEAEEILQEYPEATAGMTVDEVLVELKRELS